jgi:hypothetical protein
MVLTERFFAPEETSHTDFADWAGCDALPMPMKERPTACPRWANQRATHVGNGEWGDWQTASYYDELQF